MDHAVKLAGTALLLIGLYLVLINYQAFNTILNSLGGFSLAESGVLQGRQVIGMNGVSVGGLAAVPGGGLFGGGYTNG